MRPFRIARCLTFAAVLGAGAVCSAFADEALDKAVVAGVATRFLAPAYAALAAAARDDEAAWKSYCGAPSPAGLAAAQEAWRRLSLSFGRVQAFRFGPIGDNSTVERLYFWPERKGATAKGLARLLSGAEPLTPERVAAASAAAQGIPALERLAFGEDGTTPAVAGGAAAGRGCEAAVAIAGNVAAITDAVAGAWTAPGTGIAARLGKGDLDPALAPSMNQAASTLATGFMTGLAVIQDQKLEPIVGKTVDEARPAAAEAWRSKLSVAMMAANVEGLQAFVAALDGTVPAVDAQSWQALLTRIKTEAQALDDYPAAVADPARRKPAVALVERIRRIRAVFDNSVPTTLGLQLGFNGLDGD